MSDVNMICCPRIDLILPLGVRGTTVVMLTRPSMLRDLLDARVLP